MDLLETNSCVAVQGLVESFFRAGQEGPLRAIQVRVITHISVSIYSDYVQCEIFAKLTRLSSVENSLRVIQVELHRRLSVEGGEEVKEDGGSDLYIQTFAQMMTMVIKDRVKIHLYNYYTYI